MSTKNKSKDRDGNARLRVRRGGRRHFLTATGWYVKQVCIRPQRREEARLCRLIVREAIDAEGITFPPGKQNSLDYF